jgi:very-short-patch-repair endonuclease
VDTDALLRFVVERAGVVRRADVIAAGFGDAALARACRAGLLRRVAHGCYGLAGAPAYALAATRVAGAPTCVTALHSLRLPLLAAPEAAHVVVPSGRGAPRPGLLPPGTRLHWGAVSSRREIDVPQALAHATRCLPMREVVAAVDAALAKGLVTEADLVAARRWARRPVFDAVLRLADGRSGSIQESFVRVALVGAGLDVAPQVGIAGVGRVDLLVERRIVLEADGFEYHSNRVAFREDRRRDRALELGGYPVLRYAYEDAVFATERLVDEVVRLVELTGRQTVRQIAARRRAGPR